MRGAPLSWLGAGTRAIPSRLLEPSPGRQFTPQVSVNFSHLGSLGL